MKAFSKYLFAALLGTTILSSCSRPVAYFQPTAREQFKSPQPTVVAVTTPVETNQSASAEMESLAVPVALPQQAAPAEQIAQAKQAIGQVEAYVRNDSKLASNKKLAKRMARVSELLSTATPQAALATKAASTQKTTLVQRIMLKQMDKKIKNHLAPERTMLKSLMTVGLIVGIIGLILLIANVASPLGLIALIVGLALILVDLLR